MSNKFQTDSGVHSEIPKRKKQVGSRISQLIGFAKQAGVHIDNLKTLYAEGGGFKGLFKKIIGTKEFRAGLGELAAYGAGVVAEGASGGTAGLIAGLAFEGADMFGKATGQQVVRSFKPGEWVGIDNGQIKIKKAVQYGMDWSTAQMFGDFPSDADQEIETERLTSIGFAVCDGSRPGTTKVFNFETGDFEEHMKFQLASLPKERQVRLNSVKSLRIIKEIVLHPDPPVPKKLRCEIPCDPGEEVIYQGDTYKVVTCDGTRVRISDGRVHFDTNMSELKRGRVKHTNSWNYGVAVNSNFDSDSRSAIHAGQWVWIAPRAATVTAEPHSKKELGCVRLINGIIVDGYYALDGLRFQTHVSQVHPVLQERQEFLDQMKGFREFKSYAVRGAGVVRNFAPGKFHVLLVTGQESLNPELLEPGTNRSFMDANHSATASMPLGPTPRDRNTKRDPSELTENELIEQVAADMAKKYGIAKSTAHQMVSQADAVNSSFIGSLASNRSSAMILGVAAAALFVIFYASR